MKPVISIIIPVYNSEKYLPDTIASVMAQTFRDFECIIIDDNSTDDSAKVIRDAIKGDKRFKLIRNKENTGVSGARNIGLCRVRGEYVTFLDHDDFYSPNALESLLWVAQKHNSDITGGKTIMAGADAKFIQTDEKFNPENIYISTWDNPFEGYIGAAKNDNAAWVWRRLFRRSIIKDIKFPDELSYNEDLVFVLAATGNATKTAETNAIITYHRITDTSLGGKNMFMSDTGIFEHIKSMAIIHNMFSEKYPAKFMKNLITGMSRELFFGRLFPVIAMGKIIRPDTAKEILKHWNTGVINTRILPFWRRLRLWFKLYIIAYATLSLRGGTTKQSS